MPWASLGAILVYCVCVCVWYHLCYSRDWSCLLGSHGLLIQFSWKWSSALFEPTWSGVNPLWSQSSLNPHEVEAILFEPTWSGINPLFSERTWSRINFLWTHMKWNQFSLNPHEVESILSERTWSGINSLWTHMKWSQFSLNPHELELILFEPTWSGSMSCIH